MFKTKIYRRKLFTLFHHMQLFATKKSVYHLQLYKLEKILFNDIHFSNTFYYYVNTDANSTKIWKISKFIFILIFIDHSKYVLREVPSLLLLHKL